MKKIIRLTESDLERIVKRIISEEMINEPTDVCAELPDEELQSMEMELGNILPGASVDGLGRDIVGGVINKLKSTPEQKKELRPKLDEFLQGLKGLKLKDLMRKLKGLRQKLKGGTVTEQGIDPSVKGPMGTIIITAFIAILIGWIITEVRLARLYRKERKKKGKVHNGQCLNLKF